MVIAVFRYVYSNEFAPVYILHESFTFISKK